MRVCIILYQRPGYGRIPKQHDDAYCIQYKKITEFAQTKKIREYEYCLLLVHLYACSLSWIQYYYLFHRRSSLHRTMSSFVVKYRHVRLVYGTITNFYKQNFESTEENRKGEEQYSGIYLGATCTKIENKHYRTIKPDRWISLSKSSQSYKTLSRADFWSSYRLAVTSHHTNFTLDDRHCGWRGRLVDTHTLGVHLLASFSLSPRLSRSLPYVQKIDSIARTLRETQPDDTTCLPLSLDETYRAVPYDITNNNIS